METTGRKLLQSKKRHLGSLHETKKEVPDDTGNSRCSKKNRASVSDYSSQKGAKSPAVERAEEIQANLAPEFPSMIKLMLPSHVSSCFWLGLPKRFCDLHMPKEDTEMILVEVESGEESKTRYLAAKVGLSGGWRGFSILHKLLPSDVIVFQLVQPTKFKVYIVRSNRLDKVDGDPGLLTLEASATQMDFDDTRPHNRVEQHLEPLPQDIPQENVQNDSQMILDTYGNDSDDLCSEVLEAIRFSESVVDFKEVNSLDNFTVSVDGLIIDSELSKHVRTTYYELCYSQKSFLHDNLLAGLNCQLAAGIISETVNIADAIRACKVSTSQEHFSIWDKKLKAFENMGMNVGFLRAKLEKLLGIGSELKRCREASLQKVVQADEEMRNLQDELVRVRQAAKRLDAGIEALTLTAERYDMMFEREVDAPWPLIDFVAPTTQYSSPLIDSDESVNRSNPRPSENLTLQGPPLSDSDDSAHSSHSSSLKVPKQLKLQTKPVPIGLRFQAKVPDWTEPVNKGKLNGGEGDPENLRWLGTRVWPAGGESTKSSLKEIGKGRTGSCSCVTPGSSDCIKHHILVKRLHLRTEIGPAFLSWKFHEMGEVVSNSWTWKEQQSFSLLRQKQWTDETNFWEEASKCFPSKCKKSILSYYFNVYTPRRLSIETKTSCEQVDSDDEQVEDDDHTNSRKRCKARSDGSRKSNNVNMRYWHRAY